MMAEENFWNSGVLRFPEDPKHWRWTKKGPTRTITKFEPTTEIVFKVEEGKEED